MINDGLFLPVKELLVATLSETRALTSRKYIAEKGMNIWDSSEKLKTFCSHSTVFTLKK